MEAFSLLRYWRGGGSTAAAPPANTATATTIISTPIGSVTSKKATTIAASVLRSGHESSDDESGDEDEGPFFDLEFSVPHEDEGENEHDGTDEEDEVEVTPVTGVSLSPSDGLFFKGRLVPLVHSSDHGGKQRSLLKSATKFRVFTLKGSKKPKSADQPKHEQNHNSKFFTVKFKVEEVPIVSLFTRDGSSRGSNKSESKQVSDDTTTSVTGDEKRTSKELVNKYLNKIKPLYVKVSRRSYGEKSKFLEPDSPAPEVIKKDDNSGGGKTQRWQQTHVGDHVQTGLRVVRKHLGKSRSASAAVAAVPSPTATAIVARRRDDSLLQQQDGIQSAIAHCKRSFNATREVEPTLPRSKSDSYDERTVGGDKCKADCS